MDECGTKQRIRKVWSEFLAYAIGSFILYSSYGTLFALQSSINISAGLGTTASAVNMATSVLFALFLLPSLFETFGLKKCLCAFETTFMIFILANFHPAFYTLIPASVLVGTGVGAFWGSIGYMCDSFAKRYSSAVGQTQGTKKMKTSSFVGYFFAILLCEKVVGGLVSYTALYAFNEKETSNFTGSNSTWPSQITNDTEYSRYEFCGASDCQDAAVVKDNLSQYKPANEIALYVLLGVLFAMAALAVGIHIVFLPSSISSVEFHPESDRTDAKLKQDDGTTEAIVLVSTGSHDEKYEHANIDERKACQLRSATHCSTFLVCMRRNVKAVFKQLLTVEQFVIAVIILYPGMHYGFAVSEMTRAYTSCVIGVAWVPIHSAVYGVGQILGAFIFGRIGKGRGFYICWALVITVDLVVYMYSLLWNPHPDTAWLLFVVFFAYGVTQGTWNPLTNVLQTSHYSDCLHVSSPIWNSICTIGIGIVFGFSTSLCVGTKVYILIGTMLLSLICYVIVEIRYKKGRLNTRRDLPSTAL